MQRLSTCRAEGFGQQPADTGADLCPVEVVLVQRLDLRHREGLPHGRVDHGRAEPHGGRGDAAEPHRGNVRRRDGGGPCDADSLKRAIKKYHRS